MCVSLNHVHLFATLWTVAHQAPLSMGLFGQEYWSGLPFLYPGDTWTVQLSRVRLSVTPWTAARQSSLSITNSRSLLKLMSHPTISSSVFPFSAHIQYFPALGSFQMSQLRIRWPKYWSFSFNINPSNEHPGLVSFRRDWLDLLAVQGTLKSLLQHHSSKASILQHSAFFIVQLSHP